MRRFKFVFIGPCCKRLKNEVKCDVTHEIVEPAVYTIRGLPDDATDEQIEKLKESMGWDRGWEFVEEVV